MMTARLLISVVDDDESVRESLPDLLRELGFRAEAFSSAEDFLASDVIEQTRCLVLDIHMPGDVGTRAAAGIVAAGRDKFRLCSSPLTPMRTCARSYWRRAPWSACLSHSARTR